LTRSLREGEQLTIEVLALTKYASKRVALERGKVKCISALKGFKKLSSFFGGALYKILKPKISFIRQELLSRINQIYY